MYPSPRTVRMWMPEGSSFARSREMCTSIALAEMCSSHEATALAIVGKEKIASAVASWDEHISANAIEVHISRLRAKLEPAGIHIRTVRGLGYIVEPWSDGKP